MNPSIAPETDGLRSVLPSLRMTPDDVHAAMDAWGFNCGPGALCGVLGLTPDEVRPHLGDFESKRYSNPTLVWSALRSLGAATRVVWQNGTALTAPPTDVRYPETGLVRIQWAGSWCDSGVPMVARYRRTHWIGVAHQDGKRMVLDVNAVGFGFGWIPWVQWTDWMVPFLVRECVKGGTGVWWPTHCWEVTSKAEMGRRAAHNCGDEARPVSRRPWADRGWQPR